MLLLFKGQKCNVLVFHETWLREDEQISLPNFNCIVLVQCKRNNVRAGGVAICQNDTINVLTPHVGLSAVQSTSSADVREYIGDI